MQNVLNMFSVSDADLHKFFQLQETKHGIVCLVRPEKHHLHEDNWERAFNEMKRFMRFVKEHNTRYHFIFDCKKNEEISTAYVLQLSSYLKQKKKTIKQCLLSTTIIVQNTSVEFAINAFFMVNPPTKPLLITIHEATPEQKHNEYDISVPSWQKIEQHMASARPCD